MSFCPSCPPDTNGNRRDLLEANGTKCHGCGYTLPVDPTAFLEISAKHRTDDRHNQVYNRKVVVIFTDPRSSVLGRAQHELKKRLNPKPSDVTTYNPNSRWAKAGEECRPHQIQLTFTISATKPSKIVSEGQAISDYRAILDSLCEQINAIIGELEAEDNLKADRERVAKQATRFAQWIGESVREKALDATRYKQRLAALEAELASEIGVQVKKFNEDEAAKGQVEHNAKYADDQFSDEEIEIAKAHAEQFAVKHPGFMRSRSRVISPEQVAGHRDLDKKESA